MAEGELICDECDKKDDFVIFTKRRRTYVSCECGHEWEKGTSRAESTCPHCGNYQHCEAARKFLNGTIGCWFCFHKYGETDEAFRIRKRRGH